MAKKDKKNPATENKAAKPAKDNKATEKRVSPTQAAREKYKFGVPELAKAMGIQETSARVQLRNKGVAKQPEGVYGWNSQKELDAVVAQLKGNAANDAGADKKSKKKAA